MRQQDWRKLFSTDKPRKNTSNLCPNYRDFLLKIHSIDLPAETTAELKLWCKQLKLKKFFSSSDFYVLIRMHYLSRIIQRLHEATLRKQEAKVLNHQWKTQKSSLLLKARNWKHRGVTPQLRRNSRLLTPSTDLAKASAPFLLLFWS